mgnify:CR=1 FL=1|jgi:hypothetical protein
MATNEKNQSNARTVAKASTPQIARTYDPILGTIPQHNAAFLQNTHNCIMADEFARDNAIDAIENRVIEIHMKMLDDHDVPIEKREAIVKDCYDRIDKKRQYATEYRREHTMRFKAALWLATLSVLGIAAFRYAPEIITACSKIRKI